MRIGILAALILLCAVVATACGKDKKNNTTDVTVTPSATSTPAATATPTPTVCFYRATYETFGRDDIYRVPVAEFTKDRYVIETAFGGDYALMWLNEPVKVTDEEETEGMANNSKNIFVLLAPGIRTESYSTMPSFTTSTRAVLDDGTVILEDLDTADLHIYDNTMKELRVVAGDENHVPAFAITESGRVLTVFRDEGRIDVRDLEGKTTATITFDPTIMLSMFHGERDGRYYISGYDKDGTFRYLSVPVSGGAAEIVANDADDGEAKTVSMYTGSHNMWQIDRLASTWCFRKVGQADGMFAFSKAQAGEAIEFLQGNCLCASADFTYENAWQNEYRLYDVENRTMSSGLSIRDIPNLDFIRMRGMLGDGLMLIDYMTKDGENGLLLWDTKKSAAPISGLVELTGEAFADNLAKLRKEAEEKYGLVIDPDAVHEEKALTGPEMLRELDFVNSFIIGVKNNPDVLRAGESKTVHPENMENNGEGGHYTFQPHVFSEFYLKEHGEKRRQALFNYVDALRAGEDRFECFDFDTAGWCFGRLGYFFNLVGPIYTYAGEYKDGWVEICYRIPKEEYLKKQEEFETMICDILNDALRDDYSDIEKALALYEYMTENYTYDYEMLAHCTEWMEKQSGYRCLMEKTGICNEIAKLYQFLLLQVGVDAEESGGEALKAGDDSHAWVYVTIDGQGFLIDPTWGLTEDYEPDLAYFLFTDERRKNRDGFNPDSFDVGSCPSFEARRKYSFNADSERYKDLWYGKYVAMDTEANCIYYYDYNHNLLRFDYQE